MENLTEKEQIKIFKHYISEKSKENKMTDKEQIIIDGCKVEECVNFRDEVSIDSTVLKNACSIGLWQRHYKNLEESCKMSCKCDENPNCYFKQLARKTQECEKLKNELDLYKTWYRAKHDDVKNLLGRYRKALEKIENLMQTVSDADECSYGDFDCCNCDSDNSCPTKVKRLILDIIDKAKG